MNAIVVTQFGGPDVLEYKQMPKPQPGPRQVLIRVAATSVNFADVKARYGNYHGGQQPPFVPGLDAAGTIEAVGSEVTRFAEGQRVIAFPKDGSYADYIVADEILTFQLPDEVDMETAAAAPIVTFTSYNLLANVARIQPGETVLIHAAAGGIGTTALQLAKLLGADKVIGTVGSGAKMQIAEQVGADYVINYETEDFVARVNEITAGKGADIILDSVAGKVFEQSLECLAMFGRIVNFGNSGGKAGSFQTSGLHSSCRSVLGFSLGTHRKYRPQVLQATADAVLPFLADGRLRMTIGSSFSLQDAAKAQAEIEARKTTGKILLIP